MKRTAWAAVTALLSIGLLAGQAQAFSGGIFDQAKPSVGCNCHGGLVPPNTTTQLLIDGLPTLDGYSPGESYDVTVFVLGVAIPLGPTLASQLAGMNLQASAGTLLANEGDGTVQVRNKSECDLVSICGGGKCGVTGGEEQCTSFAECFQRRCEEPGTEDCRPCFTATVDVQAAHTSTGGAAPAAAWTDGNSLPFWQLKWTAPNAGTGDVSFWLAGNVVNGNGDFDPGDVWSVLPEPMIVPEAP